jgi:DNA repair and recombination RAD54-like protein
VTRQVIGNTFRLGQQKKVVVYRLVAADTYEERRMHSTAEWLAKLLFEPITSPDVSNPRKIFLESQEHDLRLHQQLQ